MWQWDGGLRLKIRHMKKRQTTLTNQKKKKKLKNHRERSFSASELISFQGQQRDLQSLQDLQALPSLQGQGSSRVRAATHTGGDNDPDTISQEDEDDSLMGATLKTMSHTLDHAGGWVDAASKVDHHVHALTEEECEEDHITGGLSCEEMTKVMLSSAVESFTDENLFGKVIWFVCAPLTLVRRLSIPVLGNDYFDEEEGEGSGEGSGEGGGGEGKEAAVGANITQEEEEEEEESKDEKDEEGEEDEEDGYPWSKPFAVASFLGLFTIGAFGCIPMNQSLSMPIIVLLLLIGLAGSTVMQWKASQLHPPRHRCTAIMMLSLGFVASILWIYFIANELVTILQVLGILLGIPNSILGLTVLAWANSAPDTISIVGVAKQGYVQMAIGGVYAGRMFDTLCGKVFFESFVFSAHFFLL